MTEREPQSAGETSLETSASDERRRSNATGGAPRHALTSDRVLDVVEAVLWLGLLAVGTVVGLEVMRQADSGVSEERQTNLTAIAGMVEAEDMRVVERSRDFTFWLQPTSSFQGGRWSKDHQMFAMNTRKGDWVELEIPTAVAGSYRLELFMTRAGDYGIVQLSLNGVPLGGALDLWSGQGVVPTGAVDLGQVQLAESGNRLRITVVGTNPQAAPLFFQFGIDGVRLTRQ